MSTIPISQFYKRLRQSNLLASEDLERVRRDIESVGPNMRAEALGRRLVRDGKLTEWHIQMMLSGKFAFFLGKYKLLDLLGYGGMGVVFKAEHSLFRRIVAIKVLHKERMKNPAVVARFHREIQAAATLNNPHVVIAYDADCVRDTHFLVMEYVDGTDLATILEREGKLHVDEACEYARQAAVGLQHAHERGMVHRDIKPSNLIVTGRGDEPLVKILDMGLARFVSEELEELPTSDSRSSDPGLTQVGQIMGTPDYMSPEQAWDTKAVDIRSDIYSLGCTLYLLVTGLFPFSGKTAMEKVVARTESDPQPPSRYQPEIPAELDAVILKMMARNPDCRYQSPAEVARALEPFCVLPETVLTIAASEAAIPWAEAITPTIVPQSAHESTLDVGAGATPVPRAPQPADPVPVVPSVFAEPAHSAEDDARLDLFLQGLSTHADGDSRPPMRDSFNFNFGGDKKRASSGAAGVRAGRMRIKKKRKVKKRPT
jgi:serine/threonine-protein kinase